jgi:anti-sigma regulatory factor (Ser/Thr protein kinase)
LVRRVAADLAELDDLELLVSELVTNAVVHAIGDVEFTICVGADRVRVEVGDANQNPPTLRSPDGASGRGLHLIDAVASRWGVVGRDGGKTVWFEIDAQRERAAS